MKEKVEGTLFSNNDLIRLCIPLIIEQFLAIAVGMADTMMVSYAGEAAVSGVSLVDMINNVIIVLLAALATGGAVIISQCIGAKKYQEANTAVGQLVALSGIVGFVIMIVCLVWARPIIRLFFGSIDDSVFEACRIYLCVTALSFPFLGLYNAGAAMYRSIGDSKTSMKISILMNIINITGNAICMFGLHRGVEGVAIPSVISRAVAAVIILVLATHNTKDNIKYTIKDSFNIHRGTLGKILYIGIPSGIENSLFNLGRVVVVSIIASFGTVQIAANAIANNLDGLGTTMGNAMGIAMITVIGRCVGAGDYKQADYYTKKLMVWGYASIVIPAALILIFLNQFFVLYNVSDATRGLARDLVWVHEGIAAFIWPISFILPNSLRAGSDVKFTMGVSLFSMAAFRIGISVVLADWYGLGALGVWYAMIVDWIFRAVMFTWRFKSGKWKQVRW